jgi:hypothetical protein
VHYKNHVLTYLMFIVSEKNSVSLLYQIKNSTDVPTSSVAYFVYHMCVGLMGYGQKTGSKDNKRRCSVGTIVMLGEAVDLQHRTGVDQTPQPQVRVL